MLLFLILLTYYLFKNNFDIFKNLIVYIRIPSLMKAEMAKFKYLILYYNARSFKNFISDYLETDFVKVKGNGLDSRYSTSGSKVILICAVKNDLEKIQFQYEKLIRIGVENFCYIDNGSKDGTLEWLMKAENLSVYQTKDTFSSQRKNIWYYKVMKEYPLGQWFLILDSDEVPSFPHDESIQIPSLISFLELNEIENIDSFFVDLYPNKPIKEMEYDFPLDNFNYFDNKFYLKATFKGLSVKGGFRERVFFNSNYNSGPQLRKNSLFKSSNKYIYGPHFGIPYHNNFVFEPIIAIKHYKFTNSDINKIPIIVNEKLYANDSLEYKKYLDSLSMNHTFYNIESTQLKTSHDLLKINLMRNSLVNEWLKFVEDFTFKL